MYVSPRNESLLWALGSTALSALAFTAMVYAIPDFKADLHGTDYPDGAAELGAIGCPLMGITGVAAAALALYKLRESWKLSPKKVVEIHRDELFLQNEQLSIYLTSLAILEVVLSYLLPYTHSLGTHSLGSADFSPLYALPGEFTALYLLRKVLLKETTKAHANALIGGIFATILLGTGGICIARHCDKVLGIITGVGFGSTALLATTLQGRKIVLEPIYAELYVRARNRNDQKRIVRDIFPLYPHFLSIKNKMFNAFNDNDLEKMRKILTRYPCFVHIQDDSGDSLYRLAKDPQMRQLLKEYGGDVPLPVTSVEKGRIQEALIRAHHEQDWQCGHKILKNHATWLFPKDTTRRMTHAS